MLIKLKIMFNVQTYIKTVIYYQMDKKNQSLKSQSMNLTDDSEQVEINRFFYGATRFNLLKVMKFIPSVLYSEQNRIRQFQAMENRKFHREYNKWTHAL